MRRNFIFSCSVLFCYKKQSINQASAFVYVVNIIFVWCDRVFVQSKNKHCTTGQTYCVLWRVSKSIKNIITESIVCSMRISPNKKIKITFFHQIITTSIIHNCHRFCYRLRSLQFDLLKGFKLIKQQQPFLHSQHQRDCFSFGECCYNVIK